MIDHHWSASGTDRVFACPASAVLPQVDTPAGDAAERGTAIHKFLEDYLNTDKETALKSVPPEAPWYSTCAAIDLKGIFDHTLGYEICGIEQPVAYEPETETSILLPWSEHRGYLNCPRGFIPGTADLVVGDNFGIRVLDWKTGTYVPKAEDALQLWFLAVAMARHYRVSRVMVTIAHVQEDGRIACDDHKLDVNDLAEFRQKLKNVWQAVKTARDTILAERTPNVRLGDHCRWCPALRSCPAHLSLLQYATGKDWSGEYEITNPDIANGYQRLKVLERVTEALRQTVNAQLMQGPIDLGNGSEVYLANEQRETILPRVALPMLRKSLSDEQIDNIVELKITKTSLQKELGAPATRELCEKLTMLNGIRTSAFTATKTRKIK